jgi:formamidopyrimidine-DNA glycosylase
MPELPEVETMRRGILPVVGSTILQASPAACDRKPIGIYPNPAAVKRRTKGQTITAIGRIGKRVVVHLSNNDVLIFEPRMTGLVLLADPPTQEHLRFRLDLQGGPAKQLWYWDRRGLGSVHLLRQSELAERFREEKLGPDALSLTAPQLRERLCGSRRPIKVALLDQQRLAGVGNLYASEILHQAGVHPAKRCDLLKPAQWEAIHRCMLDVLETAIRYEGSTLSDGTYRNALNESGGYQNHHRVYDRAGQTCGNCGTSTIVRIVQAQRATFFCPTCQPKRANSASPRAKKKGQEARR